MRIAAASEGGFERGDDARFAGEVWLRSTLAADDGTNIGIVHFSPVRGRIGISIPAVSSSTAWPAGAASGREARPDASWSRAT